MAGTRLLTKKVLSISLAVTTALVVLALVLWPSRQWTLDQEEGPIAAPQPHIGDRSTAEAPTLPDHQTQEPSSVSETDISISDEEPDPSAVYWNHLDRAVDGDIDSQYVVYKILDFCRGTARSEADLRHDADLGIDPYILDIAKKRYKQCKPLHEAVSNMSEQADAWFQQVLDAEHPLIEVARPTENPVLHKERIIEALDVSFDESFPYADAYFSASMYYMRHEAEKDVVSEVAWRTLYCEASLDCYVSDFLEDLQYRITRHEYEEVIGKAKEIKRLIQNRELDEIL